VVYPQNGTGARPPNSTTFRPLRGGSEDMVGAKVILRGLRERICCGAKWVLPTAQYRAGNSHP
jgi:hypothetical protein